MAIFDRKSGRKAREVEPTDQVESEPTDQVESEPSDQVEAESETSGNVMVSRLSRYSTESAHLTPAPPMVEVEVEAEAPVQPEATEQTSDYVELGEHVGAVLEAAKEAAEKMRRQAAEGARQTRADADQKARLIVEEAQKQATHVQAGAALLEAEAKERSTKTDKEAEAYAVATREAADAQAAAVLDRAERQASERVRATEARLHTLDEGVVGTEKRLRQLIAWMRDCVSSLEELVDGPVTSVPAGAGSSRGARVADGRLDSVCRSATVVRLASRPPLHDRSSAPAGRSYPLRAAVSKPTTARQSLPGLSR